MCGFTGIITLNTPPQQRPFAESCAAIAARGRSLHTVTEPTAAYGYARLPTDAIGEPMLNHVIERDGQRLLFNGLITNVEELVARFQLPANTTRSDQHCLLAGLNQHGPEFLRHCRGMFALAYITADSVLLARDSIGIKPLYYGFQSAPAQPLFAFASELKGLMPHQCSAQAVEPGHIITYSRAHHIIARDTFSYTANQPDQSLQTALRASVVEPTRRYLDQEPTKPVGLMLSGGLDSSIIAALLMKHLPASYHHRLLAFCLGRPGSSDVTTARRLADHLGLRLVHVQPYNDQQALELLPEIVRLTESPEARVAKVGLLYHALAQTINQHHIDIILGGEGADELFFGYHRFIDGVTAEQSQLLFKIFYQQIFPATLLQRYDRIFAHHLIEGRVPYLDQAVIAHADAIAPEHKVKHTTTGHISKLPLRQLAQSLGLPDYVYQRPKEKMTFGATGLANTTAAHGYLETAAQTYHGVTFAELTADYYQRQFYIQGSDILQRPAHYFTEESLTQLTAICRSLTPTNQLTRITS